MESSGNPSDFNRDERRLGSEAGAANVQAGKEGSIIVTVVTNRQHGKRRLIPLPKGHLYLPSTRISSAIVGIRDFGCSDGRDRKRGSEKREIRRAQPIDGTETEKVEPGITQTSLRRDHEMACMAGRTIVHWSSRPGLVPEVVYKYVIGPRSCRRDLIFVGRKHPA